MYRRQVSFEEFSKIGYCASVFGQQSYNGVAIIARQEMHRSAAGQLLKIRKARTPRLLAATIDGIRIVNVYIPNGQAVGSEKFEFKLIG